MSIQQLYQQSIKQHSQSPTGINAEFPRCAQAEGYNPNCGDELLVYVQLSQQSEQEVTSPTTANNSQTQITRIKKIGFTADACMICVASASLLCGHSENKTLSMLNQEIDDFCLSLKSQQTANLPSLRCLDAVAAHPSRIECALLPWKTLKKIIQQIEQNVIQEHKTSDINRHEKTQ